MIDLSKTRFIVTAWPDHRWPVELYSWIEKLTKGIPVREDFRDSLKVPNRECARNKAIYESALMSHHSFEHFVFLDRDIRPTAHTAAFLNLGTDVMSCQVPQRSKTAWSSPTAFHESVWCTSRSVLEALDPPWFVQRYNHNHTEMDGCICQYFRDLVLEAGFTISHGGWADHDRDESWC